MTDSEDPGRFTTAAGVFGKESTLTIPEVSPPEKLTWEEVLEKHEAARAQQQARPQLTVVTQDQADARHALRLSRNPLAASLLPIGSLRGDPPPVPPYVLNGLVRQGELTSLVGAAKSGKSLLAMDLVLTAVAAGRRVVYLDAENGLYDIRTRVHALGYGGDDTDLDGLLYLSFPSVTLDDPRGAAHLTEYVTDVEQRRGPVDLVVLDTASRFLSGEENDSRPWLAMYRLALLPLKRKGIAVLRLDHFGKDTTKGARGSSAKTNDVDVVWQLAAGEPDRTGSVPVNLTCTHQRSGTHPRGIPLVRSTVGGVLGHRAVGVRVQAADGTTATVERVEDQADRVVQALDDLGAARTVGRGKARELLQNSPVGKLANSVYEEALRRRKARPKSDDE